jgi:hypothetical protein
MDGYVPVQLVCVLHLCRRPPAGGGAHEGRGAGGQIIPTESWELLWLCPILESRDEICKLVQLQDARRRGGRRVGRGLIR